MKNYITIDGGTTNTRVYLLQNNIAIKSIRIPMGIKEDTTKLWSAIKNAIKKILTEFSLKTEEITAIIVSGMITREYEHIKAPVGLKELHNTMHKTEIMGISTYFIRGVKTEKDLMRGEETELYGLGELEKGLYILPGSHTKIVLVDKNRNITDIKTMLTGEMLEVLSRYTILKESVNISTNTIDKNTLIKGYECCKENGINYSLFQVRVLSQVENAMSDHVYSFYAGVVMCGDIRMVEKMNPSKIYIAGKPELCEPIALLLRYATKCKIIELSDVSTMSAIGAVKIFEYTNDKTLV